MVKPLSSWSTVALDIFSIVALLPGIFGCLAISYNIEDIGWVYLLKTNSAGIPFVLPVIAMLAFYVSGFCILQKIRLASNFRICMGAILIIVGAAFAAHPMQVSGLYIPDLAMLIAAILWMAVKTFAADEQTEHLCDRLIVAALMLTIVDFCLDTIFSYANSMIAALVLAGVKHPELSACSIRKVRRIARIIGLGMMFIILTWLKEPPPSMAWLGCAAVVGMIAGAVYLAMTIRAPRVQCPNGHMVAG